MVEPLRIVVLHPRGQHLVFPNTGRQLDVGIQGVPFFIFNGRIAVSGAQDPAALLDAIAAARKDS